MNIQYEWRPKPFFDIIRDCKENAIILVPDIQRPFVWTPDKVILLMDSIFRGWPFGSVLMWEVGSSDFHENRGIPYRTFWRDVDRVNGADTGFLEKNDEKKYMVLDGQQRIQSLLLALGEFGSGFKMFDHDWAAVLPEPRKIRTSTRWSRASLFFDSAAFLSEYKIRERVKDIEVKNVLAWVIIDKERDAPNHEKYESPLPYLQKNDRGYIRFSEIWNMVSPRQSEDYYQEKIKSDFCNKMSKEMLDEVTKPLSAFMRDIDSVKYYYKIQTQEISAFNEDQCNRDEYDDAIVQIFTRLNSAGRILTREEITLAWLKVGWDKAGAKIDELKASVNKLIDGRKFVDTDDIVRLLSFVWTTLFRSDSFAGSILKDKDLLKGYLLKQMASDLSAAWECLDESFEHTIEMLISHNYGGILSSFNSVIVAMTSYLIFYQKYHSQKSRLKETEKDDVLKRADHVFNSFIDRWLFGSDWAKVWSFISNFQTYANILKECNSKVHSSNDLCDVIDLYEKCTQDLLEQISDRVIKEINDSEVDDRSKVRLYKSKLWIWQRLDSQRWNNSIVMLRKDLDARSCEVDHMISAKWWENYLDSNLNTLVPSVLENKEDAKNIINKLGNCSLLEKNFNISKRTKPMGSFLEEIYEVKEDKMTKEDWQKSMLVTDALAHPERQDDIQGIVDAIKQRDNSIKKELVDFINGKRIRSDIDKDPR
ncbi:MAG: DUF262 domain-containing protein [Candidatus Cloacimonas sp.]